MDVLKGESANCHRCGKELRGPLSFAFTPRQPAISGSGETPPQATLKCLICSIQHLPVLKRSAIASLVVGTVLTLLNQGDLLLSGQWSNALYWKIPLTYCVPFLVATYGALSNSRR